MVVIREFDQQFPKNAFFFRAQTIEVACIVSISNFSQDREVAASCPGERKQAEAAVALFCIRLDPALGVEFVDDFRNGTTGESQTVGQLTRRSLSALMKFPQEHPFRNGSLLLVESMGKRP